MTFYPEVFMTHDDSSPAGFSGVADLDDSAPMTLGSGGPALMQDVVLLEKLAQLDRERIPERVIHAKGAGAFGWFEVTEDVSQYTCADFLRTPGLRTEVFVRFSTLAGERGYADADRDSRGFALKFYTRQGNYDLVGNNTPVFFIRDPMRFPEFVHSQKRRAVDNLRSEDMRWDFWSQVPESLHHVLFLFADRGIPATFRHMHGFGGHTFMWYNARNEHFWVKYHFKSEQGIRNLLREEAEAIKGKDPDHAVRDLYESIAVKDFPAWTLHVQIMTPEQARSFPYDPFDITKVWPHGLVPLTPVGRLVLDRLPENYFQDVEQAAFNPSSFVPGIAPSPDRMLQGRLFSYHDAHMHRLGSSFHLTPVNRAKSVQVDAPSSFTGADISGMPLWAGVFGGPPKIRTRPHEDSPGAMRHPYSVTPIDYEQPAALYTKVLNDDERERLLDNVAESLGYTAERIRIRSIVMFWKMNAHFAKRLSRAVKLDPEEVEPFTRMSFEELLRATAG